MSRKAVSETAGVMPGGGRCRIDKWVWAARFFKTRSLAVQAIEKGRVRVAGATVKPARDVHCGERIDIEIDGLVWELTVLALSEIRGPAPVARLLYAETAEGQARRTAAVARRSLYQEPAHTRDGRPTKRDRRLIGTYDRHADTED